MASPVGTGYPRLDVSNWDGVPDISTPVQGTDFMLVGQWDNTLNALVTQRVPAKDLMSVTTTAGIKDVRKESVQVTPGLIVVGGKVITVSVPGAKPSDVIIGNGFTGGLTLGTILTDVAISADNTMRMVFSTTIALGLTLGAVTFNYTRIIF